MIDSLCDRGHTSYREISPRAHYVRTLRLPYTQGKLCGS